MGRKIRMSDLQGEGDRRWAQRFDEAESEFVESTHGRDAIARDLDASAARKARVAAAKARRRAREFDPEVARDYRRPTR